MIVGFRAIIHGIHGMCVASLLRLKCPPKGVTYISDLTVEDMPPRTRYNYALYKYSLGLILKKIEVFEPFGFGYRSIVRDKIHLLHAVYFPFAKYNIPWLIEMDNSISCWIRNYYEGKREDFSLANKLIASSLRNKLFRGVITWTRHAKTCFIEDYDIDYDLVHVVPPPMECNISKKRPHQGINITFVGAWFEHKGGPILLEAFEKISREFSEIKLMMITNILNANLLKKIKGNKNVLYFGLTSREKIINGILPVTDILVLPAVGFNFSVAIEEAMSFGIPVITADLPPLREMVEDGFSGYLIPKNDVYSLTEAMRKLISDEKLRNEFSENTIRIFKERFEASTIGEKMYEVYSRSL